MSMRLGRYEVLATVGRGGMGDVYAARLRGEARFERLYAIKRIRTDVAADERFVAMFFDEARTAACIHSPNVVPVLDVGRDDDGTPFMVMDLVLGANVHDLVAAGPISLLMAHALVLDAARGLRDAHATLDPYGQKLDIVHRDVSPRNVLVGVDGTARLTDFGIAKARRRSSVSAPGEVKGSYAYFSPEHLNGAADARSDVFSLGVVAWELYSGKRLFGGRTPAEIITSVTTAPIPRLTALPSPVPPEIVHAVERALLRDRNRRWARSDDFVAALEDAPMRPASREEVGRRVCEVAMPLITTMRELDRSGISEARTLLEIVDTLVDAQFERTTVGGLDPTDPAEPDIEVMPTRRR